MKGLPNLINSCYMNAAVCTLLAIAELPAACASTGDMLHQRFDDDRLGADPTFKAEYNVVVHFCNVFCSLSDTGVVHDAPMAGFRDACLHLWSNDFQRNRQEDAYEFLRKLLDTIREVCRHFLWFRLVDKLPQPLIRRSRISCTTVGCDDWRTLSTSESVSELHIGTPEHPASGSSTLSLQSLHNKEVEGELLQDHCAFSVPSSDQLDTET